MTPKPNLGARQTDERSAGSMARYDTRYGTRRCLAGPWQLEGAIDATSDLCGAIVIPALAEGDELWRCLESLARNPASDRQRFLVTVIINNANNTDGALVAQNQRDLHQLHQLGPTSGLRLVWIDASSPGRALPAASAGVGTARKIACDLLLPYLPAEALLVHLDADCQVAASYFRELGRAWQRPDFDAGVLAYAHPWPTDPAQRQAICAYELYLRCHVAGLQWATSPYAHHSIGSTMVSRARAYVAVGGMNRRRAGEDFYFMQQLAKQYALQQLKRCRVYPAARLSNRTPFGTGQALQQSLASGQPACTVLPLASYAVLRQWLQLAPQALAQDPATVLDQAAALAPELATFLQEQEIKRIWPGLQRNHRDGHARLRAFHQWFDGLKSWQLLRRLNRPESLPGSPLDAVPEFLTLLQLPTSGSPADWLLRLRRLQQKPDATATGP
ncbi:MAG: hypothetical protein RBR03_05780 [Desulfuromonas thiophila]|nr:hypothetical protein [Desulfuromonas thiophila]